jgi:hypothetical protein
VIATILIVASPVFAVEARYGGSGVYHVDRSVPCITDAQRAEIQAELTRSIATLRAQGRLTPPTAESVSFGWPLRPKSGLTDPGVHGISNFIDHDVRNPGFVQDYMCGTRTYDITGYDHAGTDIFLWPFYWYKMDHDEVEIVAAAAGTIVFKSDGNFDRSCAMGSGNWNAVYVQHADGSIAFYGHMKSGSVTPKGIGETVAQGEFLGRVGSSGSSTGPHLHFEVHGTQNEVIDPWAGPCNLSTPTSWWASQRPYDDSAINALRTHDQPPEFPPCPQPEVPHERTAFFPGEIAYFAAYYRDQLSGQVSNYAVYDAANGLVSSWSHSSPAAYYAASYWYWYFTLPNDRPLGWWRFSVTYQGTTIDRPFFVGDASGVWEPIEITDDVRFVGGVPNPASAGTVLSFEIPRGGRVQLVLLDGAGRTLASLADQDFDAGPHRVAWDGRIGGRPAPPGLYFAQLRIAGRTAAQKIVVTR